MKKENLPAHTYQRANPLWDDILKFSKRKWPLAIVLFFVGILGFVIPVIPGFLFILFAVALLKPGLMTKVRSKLKSIFR